MLFQDWVGKADRDAAGKWSYDLMHTLFPICRSITGEGVRESLALIKEHIPLDIHEVPTGTQVFDWIVPREWNIHDGYIKDAAGNRIVDFQQHNLHVMNYSAPVSGKVSLEELKAHCHTLPAHPDRIPYRTSYYNEDWGFCLTQNQLAGLTEPEYEVCIDSTLTDGSLTYGELFIPGRSSDEIFITSHICHPSLANDNLSSIGIAVFLAKELSKLDLRYSYRFVFAPATIGAITWLARNEDRIHHIKHGLCLACTGDPANVTYKRSRHETAEIDRAMEFVLEHRESEYTIEPFTPWGYDERQYGSQGIDLPLGCFMRSAPDGYGEYHSSADNLDLVQPEYLADSLDALFGVIEVLEGNGRYRNLNPKCEAQLGPRGLYGTVGGMTQHATDTLSVLWVLNYSDGEHSLLDIATKSGYAFAKLRGAADALLEANLLEACD